MKKILTLTTSLAAALALAACGGGGGNPESVGAATGSGGGGVTTPPGPGPSGTRALTVVVVAVDSLMPEDIDAAVMPNIASLIENGTQYTESRSVFSAETIPNHIAMMTGVYPDRNGIPTNNFWDKGAGVAPDDEDLDNPNEIEAKTLFTWIDEKCRNVAAPRNAAIRTGAVLSKKYLYEVFRGDADDPQTNDAGIANVQPDELWDPETDPNYIGPGSEHTTDIGTGPETVRRLPNVDFMFVNLGDVDRSAHAGGPGPRMVTRGTADSQVGTIIQALQDAGRWERTVMIIVSDHGMDFSDPTSSPPSDPPEFNESFVNSTTNSLSTQPLLDQLAAPQVAGLGCGFEAMFAVQNGGTNSIYLEGLAAGDTNVTTAMQDSLLAARTCLTDFDGNCEAVVGASCKATLSKPTFVDKIEQAWYANPLLYEANGDLIGNLAADIGGMMPPEIKSRHENLGELVLAIEAGFKFSEPDISGNPIPGNHGHMPTIHNTMIVSGGASFLNTGVTVDYADGADTAVVASNDHFSRAPAQSENIDVAATVAWVLGLNIADSDFPDAGGAFQDYGDSAVRSGFDGRVLTEAFNTTTPPSDCGLIADTP